MSNPVFQREWKMRWRNRKTTFLIFAYAALLAILVGWIYNDSFERLNPGSYAFASTASRVGRDLFILLCGAQLGVWLLLAPALTATGISRERERGLLEGVQLSLLSPRQIITGNFRSALSFLVLLLPVALPVISICFLLGGVSPSELGVLTLLQFVSAMNAAAIGLFFAARSRRALGALVASFFVGALWVIGSTISFSYFDSSMRWRPAGTVPYTEDIIMGIPALFSPVAAFSSLIENQRTVHTIWNLTPWSQVPFWSVNIVLQLLMTVGLLEAARRAVAKPLPPQTVGTSWSEPVRRAWRNRMQRLAEHTESRRERASLKAAQRAGDALLWEIPLHKLINFKSPIMRREIQSKFRWRSDTWWSKLLQFGATLLGGLCFVALLYNVFDPPSRSGAWWGLANMALAALMLSCGVMGATAFTREREGGTWEGLQLSLLKPQEVLRAKLFAPLLACFYYALPLLLVAVFYIRPGASSESSQGGYFSLLSSGVPPSQAMGTFMILISSAVFCVAFGLLISSLCERTVTSVAWTLGLLLAFLTVGQFVIYYLIKLWRLFFSPTGEATYFDFPQAAYIWHPFMAMDAAKSGIYRYGYWGSGDFPNIYPGFSAALPFFVSTLVTSALLIFAAAWILGRKMRPDAAIPFWKLDRRSQQENITATESA